MKQQYLAYIGTNSTRGSLGIYTLSVDAGTLQPAILSTCQAYNSGSLALSADDRCLYAVAEGMTFRGLADGGVTGYATSEDGRLRELGGARTHGQRPCCVAVDQTRHHLYACSFFGGTLSMFPLADDGAPLPARIVVPPPTDVDSPFQALHCVLPIGEAYVGVISLTECALIIYAVADGRRVTAFPFPGKPFPRYLEVCGDYIYALMQDPGDIYVFRNLLAKEWRIMHIQTLSVQWADYSGHFGTTTLRATPDGRLMLAATRRNNTLTVFRVQDDGTLALGDIVTLPGETPRDFHISRDGRIAVTALQKSDEVCVHEIDYENATLHYHGGIVKVPSPAAVAVSGRYDVQH